MNGKFKAMVALNRTPVGLIGQLSVPRLPPAYQRFSPQSRGRGVRVQSLEINLKEACQIFFLYLHTIYTYMYIRIFPGKWATGRSTEQPLPGPYGRALNQPKPHPSDKIV